MDTGCTVGSETGHPRSGNGCFFIAEAGVNHNGSLDLAIELIDAAKASGADAVKFQTFRSSEIATLDAPKCEYQKRGTAGGQSQAEMLRALELSAAEHRRLAQHCDDVGIEFMSTAFDIDSVDLLIDLGVKRFKIPSGELTNLPLIQHVASLRCQVIISTGMASLGEVERAVETAEAAGGRVTLLHCVSAYPAPLEEINLRAMVTLGSAFDLPIGFSDHTLGITVSPAAVAMGAAVIEKHFTIDRTLPGPDHAASVEPDELRLLLTAIRDVETALGSARKRITASERDTAVVARRSLVAARDIGAGETIDAHSLTLRRPGTGLPPDLQRYLTGRTARRPIPAGTLLQLADVA